MLRALSPIKAALGLPHRHARTLDRHRYRALAVGMLFLMPAAASAAQPQEDSALPRTGESGLTARAALQAVRAAQLDVDGAVRLQGVHLDTGFARLSLEDGILFPVRTPQGRLTETVFLGQGVLHVEPPDDIEAGQLELFTGNRSLAETFDEAVFVLASDTAQAALLERPLADDIPPEIVEAARQRLSTWRARRERDLFEVEAGIALDHLGDPLYASYFTAWFRGEELGELFLSVQPEDAEQLVLGRFQTFEAASARQERQFRRELDRSQRRGRLLGLQLEDLGRWDTWISTSLRAPDGTPRPGATAFEPRHYELEVELDTSDLALRAQATLQLEPQFEGAWSVPLTLHNDLEIESVVDGEGQRLVFTRQGNLARVFLGQPSSKPIELEVAFRGRILQEGMRKNWALADNFFWYPHTGQRDLATYGVTIRWPHRLELLAGGELVAEGRDGKYRWQKRRSSRPSAAMAFAVGRYKMHTRQVGEIEVVIGIDRTLQDFDRLSLEEIAESIASSLAFYEKTFGPYPYGRLEVASVPGGLSQSLPGFLTLSELMMLGNEKLIQRFQIEDRRTVVAHEVAHQWWGHAIGWASYRDQWISEAMANYSALLWARKGNQGRPVNLGRGPTAGWSAELTRTLDDGRPVESVGPLVLGERLSSSRSGNAYSAIVYRKGAVVLDMLARRLGEETFVAALGALAKAATGHSIDTAQFLDLLGQATGTDLDPFAERFVYGTGLVDVYYSYEVAPPAAERESEKTASDATASPTTDDAPTWTVRIIAEQEMPYHLRYAIVEENGHLRVDRQRIDQIEHEAMHLVVPVRIVVAPASDSSQPSPPKKGREATAQQVLNGRMLLDKQHSEASFPISFEPKTLVLDPDRQIFGRFWNAVDDPKRIAYYRAFDRASSASETEAREAFTRVLGIRSPIRPDATEAAKEELADSDRNIDAQTYLQLASLSLDRRDLSSAREELRRAEDLLERRQREISSPVFDLFAARMALLEGNAKDALRLLSRRVIGKSILAGKNLKSVSLDTAEAWAYLAIAARAAGDDEILASALENLRQKGVDLGPLEPES